MLIQCSFLTQIELWERAPLFQKKIHSFIRPTNATNARGVKYLNLKPRAQHDVFMRQGPAKAVLDTLQGSLDCNMLV